MQIRDFSRHRLRPAERLGRFAATEWTGERSSIWRRGFAVVGEILGIRLKENPRERFFGWNRMVSVGGLFWFEVRVCGPFKIVVPEIFNCVLPNCRAFLREIGGGLRQRRRRDLRDRR